MSFPPELVEVSVADDGFASDFCQCIAIERSMHTMMIKVFTADGQVRRTAAEYD